MRTRTLLTLALFGALLGVAFWVRRIPEKGDRRSDRPGAFAPIPAAEIAKVTIRNAGQTVVLRRGDKDAFRVAEPVDYPADSYATKTMVEKLGKILFDEVVTDRPDKQAEFEVDDAKGTRVTVLDKSGKVRADFLVGKYVNGTTMMRQVGRNQVFGAVGSLKFVFAKDAKGWRDKTILDFKREDAQRLEVETAAGRIVLKKKDETTWEVESSPIPIANLDQAMPSQIVTSLAALKANDFADGAGPEAGLDKPEATLSVTLKDGNTRRILVGAHKGEKGDDVYVRPPDGRQVFLLRKQTIERIARHPIEFRDKTVLSFKADDAVEIKITKGKGALTLVRNGGDWATRPSGEIDAAKVRTLVAALANLKASTLSDDAVAGKPTGEVAVRLRDNTRATVRVGALVGDSNYYVQRDGRDDAFLVGKYTVDRFLVDADGLKPAKK
jgi:uncharacterized protein DUF4340